MANAVLNISEATSIAIHSLALIGGSAGNMSVKQIAALTGSSRNHIAKVLQLLVKRGYVASGRGPRGGYVLKTDPAEISLLEIYELIEGKPEAGNCSIHDETCPFDECVFGGMKESIKRDFVNYMAKETILHIIETKYKNRKN